MTKASKMVFLSKPPHTLIHTLYSSADSWRLEFWLIHFPLIINILSPLQLPAITPASVGPWWNNAYPLVATVCTREKELLLFSRSPWALLKGAHLWMHVVQRSSRLYLFFSSMDRQWGRENSVPLIQSRTGTAEESFEGAQWGSTGHRSSGPTSAVEGRSQKL